MGKVEKIDDAKLKIWVADMEAQDSSSVTTSTFLQHALRQGCPVDFNELKWDGQDKLQLQAHCKDPKLQIVKYFNNEIVKPTQLRNLIFTQFRKDKQNDWSLLQLKLDNPSFETGVLRMFALDLQARG